MLLGFIANANNILLFREVLGDYLPRAFSFMEVIE
jgi:hypothetical protein